MHRHRRHGFSVVEIVIAIMVGAVLTTMFVRSFNTSSWGISVRQAQQAFASMHAKARAHAIERGETVYLHLDADGDSVWIVGSSDQIDAYRFRESLNVGLGHSEGTTAHVCFTPRGIADPRCAGASSGTLIVRFQRGTAVDSVRVLPLGQIRS